MAIKITTMKFLKYILIVTVALTLAACNDSTVYPDTKSQSIKALDLKMFDINLAHPLPDGSIIVPVESSGVLLLARVFDNGSYTLSDKVSYINNFDFIANSIGEGLFAAFTYENGIYGYSVTKLDENGNLGYHGIIEGYIPTITLLDNGDIVYINQEFINGSSTEKLVMHIVGKNFKYVMAKDFNCTNVFAYEDKLFLYNTSGDYCIFNTNGTFVNNGSLGNNIFKIHYADGFLYVITHEEEVVDFLEEEPEPKDNNGVYQWGITKIDNQGNQQFTYVVESLAMFGNFSTDGKNIIVTGSVSTNYKNGEGYGAIFLLDINSGKLTETIALDYADCDILPFYVLPNKNNGYTVYTLRRNNFDDVTTDRQDFAHLKTGKIYIYNTNDLHNLQINNK